jgi:hypothetical protein
MLKQVLHQVLKQNPSKAQAKSKQRQGQGLESLWLAYKSNRHLRNAQVRDVLELRASHAN